MWRQPDGCEAVCDADCALSAAPDARCIMQVGVGLLQRATEVRAAAEASELAKFEAKREVTPDREQRVRIDAETTKPTHRYKESGASRRRMTDRTRAAAGEKKQRLSRQRGSRQATAAEWKRWRRGTEEEDVKPSGDCRVRTSGHVYQLPLLSSCNRIAHSHFSSPRRSGIPATTASLPSSTTLCSTGSLPPPLRTAAPRLTCPFPPVHCLPLPTHPPLVPHTALPATTLHAHDAWTSMSSGKGQTNEACLSLPCSLLASRLTLLFTDTKSRCKLHSQSTPLCWSHTRQSCRLCHSIALAESRLGVIESRVSRAPRSSSRSHSHKVHGGSPRCSSLVRSQTRQRCW